MTPDGNLHPTTNKSQIITVLENMPTQQAAVQHTPNERTCLVVDGMAVVHELTAVNTFETCSDLSSAYVALIEAKGHSFSEVRVVFDNYAIPGSLKDGTRERRNMRKGTKAVKVYKAEDTTKIRDIKSFLASTSTKDSLTIYLAQKLVETAKIPLIVATCKHVLSNECGDIAPGVSSQEEADTLMILHAVEARQLGYTVHIYTQDTDVLLLALRRNDQLGENAGVLMGTSDRRRLILLQPIYDYLGPDGANALCKWHALTGCDTTGHIRGKSKKACFDAFMKVDQDTLSSIASLGVGAEPSDDTTDGCISFLCSLFCKKGVTITEPQCLRWTLFKQLSTEKGIDSLPPTYGAWKEHVRRAHCQASLWEQDLRLHPVVPDPLTLGWMKEGDRLIPVLSKLPPAPAAVVELVRYDLRLIVKTKEERAVTQEADIAEHESRVRELQDDARLREQELLQDLDILHDKNQILSQLLDIVKDRAEAAEDELDRVITEINEAQASQSSDDRSVNSARSGVSPLSGVSVGSDDVFDGSPTDKGQTNYVWEDQFKKRINTLERLLAEERKKAAALQKKLQIVETDTISSAMSDDVKLHMREKELLQTELMESQKHVKIASDQIKGLTDRLKRVESDRWLSPRSLRRSVNAPTVQSGEDAPANGKDSTEKMCPSCVELQAIKDQLKDELSMFKEKSMDLEVKVDEINDIWVSKSSVSEAEKQKLEGMLREKKDTCKRLDDALGKLREEDRMKDIFLRERDNTLKDKTNIISRKEELIHEQEEIIRQREDDLQSLLDQISQQEKHTKELTETIRVRDERLKEKDDILHNLNSTIEEKTDELHDMEEEIHDTTLKRKESETLLADMKEQLDSIKKEDKTDLETENERLQSDVDNLMANINDLHNEKTTLQNELDNAKTALSEAMLMWDRDRSVAGADINKAREKVRMYEMTVGKKDSQSIQLLRKEVHTILEAKEKLANELRLFRMEHDNTMRILKNEKFKLTEELTSKIRMLTHEISNNDKMSDELAMLRGQDDINYQLHHHGKVLRAEHLAMKVRYETQLDRLQKEQLTFIGVVEKLQKEKNLDREIIVGVQRSMQHIRDTYNHDLSRWRDERRVLENHIKQIDEGREIALHLKGQIEGLKHQLTDQEVERTELVNRMTTERKGWDINKATYISKQNQLEEQLAVFISTHSKNKDIQYRMEVAWQKEREEQKRLLTDAHCLALDMQDQLHRRDEEFSREKKNLLDQLEREKRCANTERFSNEKIQLEVQTNETKMQHSESELGELREKHKKELDFCMREKGDLLRRLAEMRKIHNRDIRRIDDVLTSLKRLRELAAIVIDNDAPDSGPEGATPAGGASAASPSATSGGETAMADLKQNIDQIILKHIKESLKQIHFVAEELARPVNEVSKEEKQKMRRSLSSSELELLKDEFILGPPETGKILSHHETIPGVKSHALDREHIGVQRRITHDGASVLDAESVPPEYVEKILREKSTSYKDGTREETETHVIRVSRDVTRTVTKIASLPKPPPSFIIPRSRSNSPSLNVKSSKQPHIIRSIPIETSGRLSAPPCDVTSLGTSAGSTPAVNTVSLMHSHRTQHSLPGSGVLHIGSLDRLSPTEARRKFFESQPSSTVTYMSWPERNRKLLQEDMEQRSLSKSSELHGSVDAMDRNSSIDRTRGLRTSLSVDDASFNSVHASTSSQEQTKHKRKGMKKSQSIESSDGKHGGLRDMFAAVKRKLRPKLKRSQSARDPSITQETGPKVKTRPRKDESPDVDDQVDKHVVQERMTQIPIPEDKSTRLSRRDEDFSKDRSRSASAKLVSSQDSTSSTPLSKAERIKRHFRSRSVDRVSSKEKDPHITPILVGHLSASQTSDSSWQFSETPV